MHDAVTAVVSVDSHVPPCRSFSGLFRVEFNDYSA